MYFRSKWPPFSLILNLFDLSFSHNLISDWVQVFFVCWTQVPKIWWSTKWEILTWIIKSVLLLNVTFMYSIMNTYSYFCQFLKKCVSSFRYLDKSVHHPLPILGFWPNLCPNLWSFPVMIYEQSLHEEHVGSWCHGSLHSFILIYNIQDVIFP